MDNRRTLIVVAHPDLTGSRINHAWTAQLMKIGSAISVHDLYQTYPTGEFDVTHEQNMLESHHRIILQFPLYWFSVSSLLKCWIDEVFLPGWSHGPGGNKLEGKEFGLAISVGRREEAYQAGRYNHFSISEIIKPLQLTALFVRARFLPPFVFYGARYNYPAERLEASSRAYADYATRTHSLVL